MPPCPTSTIPRTTVANGSFSCCSRLDVVSQHQLFRMRVEVDLVLNVLHLMHFHVMFDECDGHDQWHQTLVILRNHVVERCPFLGLQSIFKVPHNMLQHIDLLAFSRFDRERAHEQCSIVLHQFSGGVAVRFCH